MLTTHELARLLLAAPDRPAVINDATEGTIVPVLQATVCTQDDIDYTHDLLTPEDGAEHYAVGDVVITVEA